MRSLVAVSWLLWPRTRPEQPPCPGFPGFRAVEPRQSRSQEEGLAAGGRTIRGYPAYPPGDADCDDLDPNTWPGAAEICDRFDNDCDGPLGDGLTLQPDGVSLQPDERDQDGDGYTVCGDADCDDTLATINPGVGNCP